MLLLSLRSGHCSELNPLLNLSHSTAHIAWYRLIRAQWAKFNDNNYKNEDTSPGNKLCKLITPQIFRQKFGLQNILFSAYLKPNSIPFINNRTVHIDLTCTRVNKGGSNWEQVTSFLFLFFTPQHGYAVGVLLTSTDKWTSTQIQVSTKKKMFELIKTVELINKNQLKENYFV